MTHDDTMDNKEQASGNVSGTDANVFRTLADRATDAILLIGSEGELLYKNVAAEVLFGKGPDTVADFLSKIELADGWEDVVQHTRVDGTDFAAQLTVSLLSAKEASQTVFAAFIHDVTEQHTAERALLDAEWEKEMILDSLSDHVVYQDVEHKVLWANKAACTSVEMTREALIGRYCYEIWPQLDHRCPDCPVAEAMANRRPYSVQKTTPDGRTWFIQGYPVIDPESKVVGGIEVTRDITERVRLEQERAAITARRGRQVQIMTAISQDIAAITELEEIYRDVVKLVKERFGYYHVQIFKYEPFLKAMALVEGYGEVGQAHKAAGYTVPRDHGVVGQAETTGQPVLVPDVRQAADWTPHLDLADARGELAVPIQMRGEPLGVLDVLSDAPSKLTTEDQDILVILAGQIASAIDNTRLLAQTQSALDEVEATYSRYVSDQWTDYFTSGAQPNYERTLPGVPPLEEILSAATAAAATTDVVDTAAQELAQAIERAVVQRSTVLSRPQGPGEGTAHQDAALVTPIRLREEIIGVLGLETLEGQAWSDDDIALVAAVADQLALAVENARLIEETRRRAAREQILREVSQRVSSAADVDAVLRTAVQEIGRTLNRQVFAYLDNAPPTASAPQTASEEVED